MLLFLNCFFTYAVCFCCARSIEQKIYCKDAFKNATAVISYNFINAWAASLFVLLPMRVFIIFSSLHLLALPYFPSSLSLIAFPLSTFNCFGFYFLFFATRGGFPLSTLRLLHIITQWSCSASGSLWEMPVSNPGPLPQKSGWCALRYHWATTSPYLNCWWLCDA